MLQRTVNQTGERGRKALGGQSKQMKKEGRGGGRKEGGEGRVGRKEHRAGEGGRKY